MPLIAAIMVVIINIVQRSLGDVVVHIGPAGVGNIIVIINVVHKRLWVGIGHAGQGEGALLTKDQINPRTNIVQLWILNHPHPQQHHYPHLAPEGGGKALPCLPHGPQEVLQGKLEVLKMTELSEKNWNHSSLKWRNKSWNQIPWRSSSQSQEVLPWWTPFDERFYASPHSVPDCIICKSISFISFSKVSSLDEM